MKGYAYQIGGGTSDTMPMPSHSEAVYADSLGEAIDEAKAITNPPPPARKGNNGSDCPRMNTRFGPPQCRTFAMAKSLTASSRDAWTKLPYMAPAVAALTCLALPTALRAAPAHCMARILMDVPAEEAPEQVKSKSNGDFGPVTTVKVNRKTGRMSYCAENSYCYNSNAFEFTTPCRLKLDKDDPGYGTFFKYFTR